MYRIFSMGYCGTLFQLSSSGWIRARGASFQSLRGVRCFFRDHPIMPPLPNGQAMADSYIGKVDAVGDLIETYSHLAENSNGGNL